MDCNQERRYDVDWIRTLALGVLILYHIGMYYVADCGWHIKSEETSELLQDVMLLTNPWRMSLLFFIAAIALGLVRQRYSSMRLVALRSSRLLVPLLFGMFIVVVPQIYFEALSQELIAPGFFAFWQDYINPNTELLKDHHSVIGLLTWNHLWFLPYLWVYSLIFVLLHKPIEELVRGAVIRNTPAAVMILFVVTLLVFVWNQLRSTYPPTNALVNDWYNHGKYFLVFSLGYLFTLQKDWWSFAIKQRRVFLITGLCGYAFLIADRHDAFSALAGMYESNILVKLFYGSIMSINHWAWILAVVGFAGFWLNRPSPKLQYATEAILPWYILHQTLIIVFAWWLKPLAISPLIESLLLIVMTLAGCALGYEVIRRIRLLRFLCGMKLKG